MLGKKPFVVILMYSQKKKREEEEYLCKQISVGD